MNAVLLVMVIIGLTLQNTTKKAYNIKVNGAGVYLFSVLSALTALLYFLVLSNGFEWSYELLPYAIGFAVSYTANTVFSVLAVSCGSLSLTTLLCSYSLMMPIAYGLLFLQDPVSVALIPGLVLLVVSLFLINKAESDASINPKWVLFTVLALLGNGMCCIIQKMQQVSFAGECKTEFMILSLSIVVIFLLPMAFFFERKSVLINLKSGWRLGALCGLMNGMVNHLVLILTDRMWVSLLYSLISGGSIVATYIVSKFVYREILTKRQLIGFLLGTVSVVLLSI